MDNMENKEMKKTEKKKQGLLYKIAMVFLILIILFSLYKIGTIVYGYYQGSSQYKQVQQMAGVDKNEKFTGEIDFETLLKENEDVRGWIYLEGTVINYPIMQASNNEYYLYRMFNGEYNGAGSIFVDYRNDDPFNSFNTVLHGHRMKDGTMFKPLVEYVDTDFYNEHKVMQITTPETKYDLHIFAVATIPSSSDLYQFEFFDDAAKTAYLERIQAINQISTNVSVSKDDKIVMMSTCTAQLDENRYCVFGKLVEAE